VSVVWRVACIGGGGPPAPNPMDAVLRYFAHEVNGTTNPATEVTA
jgi:hypothetical protein